MGKMYNFEFGGDNNNGENNNDQKEDAQISIISTIKNGHSNTTIAGNTSIDETPLAFIGIIDTIITQMNKMNCCNCPVCIKEDFSVEDKYICAAKELILGAVTSAHRDGRVGEEAWNAFAEELGYEVDDD